MIEATVKLESVTIRGTVHPLKGERYSCDLGHMEIFPDGQDYDILDEVLEKFRGKRVKVIIEEEKKE